MRAGKYIKHKITELQMAKEQAKNPRAIYLRTLGFHWIWILFCDLADVVAMSHLQNLNRHGKSHGYINLCFSNFFSEAFDEDFDSNDNQKREGENFMSRVFKCEINNWLREEPDHSEKE